MFICACVCQYVKYKKKKRKEIEIRKNIKNNGNITVLMRDLLISLFEIIKLNKSITRYDWQPDGLRLLKNPR